MKTNDYDIFISFSMSESKTERTKSFYIAKKLSNVINNLIGVRAYFCDAELSDRKNSDFQTELMNKVSKSKIFLMILLDMADTNKPYFKSERMQFIETHGDDGSFILLANDNVLNRLSELDVFQQRTKNLDVFNLEKIDDVQKALALINNLSYEFSGSNKISNIKICKNCHKIFHNGNEIGSVCSFHPGAINSVDKLSRIRYFSCCNQRYICEGLNDIVDISPGCAEGSHLFN